MIKYLPGWATVQESETVNASELRLQQRLYGETYPIPRLTAWYSDIETPYVYSRQSTPAEHFPGAVADIKARLNAEFGPFNSCLANYYRNGSDSVAWHRDDEDIFITGSMIASVSFGATRKFCFRNIRTREKLIYNLADRDLILFDGEHKEEWEHTVPKQSGEIGPRLNLTFRILK